MGVLIRQKNSKLNICSSEQKISMKVKQKRVKEVSTRKECRCEAILIQRNMREDMAITEKKHRKGNVVGEHINNRVKEWRG